jgi:hypothetical protein
MTSPQLVTKTNKRPRNRCRRKTQHPHLDEMWEPKVQRNDKGLQERHPPSAGAYLTIYEVTPPRDMAQRISPENLEEDEQRRPPSPHPTQPSMHLDEDDDGKQRTPSSGATLSPRGAYDIQATDEGGSQEENSIRDIKGEVSEDDNKRNSKKTVKKTTEKAANTLPAIRMTKSSKKTMKTATL